MLIYKPTYNTSGFSLNPERCMQTLACEFQTWKRIENDRETGGVDGVGEEVGGGGGVKKKERGRGGKDN